MLNLSAIVPFRRSETAASAIGAVLLFSCLTILLAPRTWSGNEIIYFDLANRWIGPEQFSDFHSTRDSSIARIVSFLILGIGIESLGMEGAYRAFGLFFLLSVPISCLTLIRALRVDYLSAGLSLFIILLLGKQSLMGGEFLFGSIEPKTFAYTAVCFGLAAGFSGRRLLASVVFASAVYFHFLVGAYWGAAMVLYFLLEDRGTRNVKLPFAIFVGLSLPLLIAIFIERSGAGVEFMDPMSPSLNTIYAEIRAPHHIAPYADMQTFYSTWFWGFVFHGVLAGFFACLAWKSAPRDRSVSAWLASLNAYILIAAIIAYFDRNTHTLSAFYLFRPGALILLLSILWGTSQLLAPIARRRCGLSIIVVALALAYASSAAINAAARVARGPATLASLATTSQMAMIDWISQNAGPNAVFLVEPLPSIEFMGEGGGIWVGIERLIGRPTIINFKFVPTKKAELARWYKLLVWRQAVFEGDCVRIAEAPVEFLITRTPESVQRLGKCSEVVWRVGDNSILRVFPRA